MKFKDLTGLKLDKITVVGFNRKEKKEGRTDYYWNCVCECGKPFVRTRTSLLQKNHPNKSCGCYSANRLSQMRKTHNMTDTRLYSIYLRMKSRVLKPYDRKYPIYGGRGIGISESWKNDFINFYNDMSESYEEHLKIHGIKNTTLERINVDGDYCKENCTWATLKEQGNNKQIHRRKFVAINLTTGERFYGNNKKEMAITLGFTGKQNHIGCVLNGHRNKTQGYTFKYIDEITN